MTFQFQFQGKPTLLCIKIICKAKFYCWPCNYTEVLWRKCC